MDAWQVFLFAVEAGRALFLLRRPSAFLGRGGQESEDRQYTNIASESYN